jgi:WD40 repeat protein
MNFNGTSDYLQIPALTMDAIEIDCVIDSSQSASAMFLDARNGLSNGHITIDGNGGGWTDLQVDGVPTSITSGIGLVPKNKRVKIKLNAINSFTDDVTIFGKWDTTGNKVKGTIYKINFYLNGKVIYSLDLENKFYPSQNLIPDFEDSRWSIHPNAQVLGKDTLNFNPTGSFQRSTCDIALKPNTNYLLTCDHNGTIGAYNYDNGEVQLTNGVLTTLKSVVINSGSFTSCKIHLNSGSIGAKPMFFNRPQLYALDGKEGTINGSPVKQLDSAKRKLYAKR